MEGAHIQLPTARDCTAKQMNLCLFPAAPLADICSCFHCCHYTEEASIRNRVIQARKCAMAEEAHEALDIFVASIRRAIRSTVEPQDCEPFGEYAFKCGGKQGERYQRSLAEMDGDDFHPMWATVYLFVKVENVLLGEKGCVDLGAEHQEDEPPDPRAIQAASDQMNLGFRTFVGPIESVAYPTLSEAAVKAGYLGAGVPNTFGKGQSSWCAADMVHSQWQAFDRPVMLSVDASRADAHLHLALQQAKFKIYEAFLTRRGVRQMRRYIKHYLYPKCRGLKGTKYDLGMETMLRSGYMDTSLANNVIFFMIHCLFRDFLVGGKTYELLKHLLQHVPIKLEPHDYRPFINGDDTIPLVEHEHYEVIMALIVPFFALFGIDLRIEGPPAHEMEDIEWCQAKPVLMGDRYRFVRNPRKVLSTLTSGPKFWLWDVPTEPSLFTAKQLRYLKDRLYTVAVCEKSCSIGVPVLQAYCNVLIKLGNEHQMSNDELKSVPSYYRMLAEGGLNWRQDVRITREARASFAKAFGISIEEQLWLENHFEKMTFPEGYNLGFVDDNMSYRGPPSGRMVYGYV